MFGGLNTKKQGDVGLGIAIGYFATKGYTVSVPLTDSQDYDLVVDMGELKRVQVKTTRYKHPKSKYYAVGLNMRGGNSKKNYTHKKGVDMVYDFLFILVEDGTKYLIPKSKIGSGVSLGKKYEIYKL